MSILISTNVEKYDQQVAELNKLSETLDKLYKGEYNTLLDELNLGISPSHIQNVQRQSEYVVNRYKTRYSHLRRETPY